MIEYGQVDDLIDIVDRCTEDDRNGGQKQCLHNVRIRFRLFAPVISKPFADHTAGKPEDEKQEKQSGKGAKHCAQSSAGRTECRAEKVLA